MNHLFIVIPVVLITALLVALIKLIIHIAKNGRKGLSSAAKNSINR